MHMCATSMGPKCLVNGACNPCVGVARCTFDMVLNTRFNASVCVNSDSFTHFPLWERAPFPLVFPYSVQHHELWQRRLARYLPPTAPS